MFVTIQDCVDGYLNFDLRDLLQVLKPWGEELIWIVRHFDGRGPALRRLADAQPLRDSELRLSWIELQQFATDVEQTYDGVFAGMQDPSLLPPGQLDVVGWAETDIIIEAWDSTYWRVYSSNMAIIEALEKRFSSTQRSTPSQQNTA